MSRRTVSRPLYFLLLTGSYCDRLWEWVSQDWRRRFVCRHMLRKGMTLDDVVLYLRKDGYDQIGTSRFLQREMNLPYQQAKIATLQSPAWSDRLDETIALHDTLWAAWEAIEQEQRDKKQPQQPSPDDMN